MQKQGFMFVYVLLYALIDLYVLCSALCVAYNANQAKHLCKGLHMLLYSALVCKQCKVSKALIYMQRLIK